MQIFFKVWSDDLWVIILKRRASESLVEVDRSFNNQVGMTTTIGASIDPNSREHFYRPDKRFGATPFGGFFRNRTEEDEDTVRSAEFVLGRQDTDTPVNQVTLLVGTGVCNSDASGRNIACRRRCLSGGSRGRGRGRDGSSSFGGGLVGRNQ